LIQEIETRKVCADLGQARDRFFYACVSRADPVCDAGKPRRDFV
jgi:hypothetical protein